MVVVASAVGGVFGIFDYGNALATPADPARRDAAALALAFLLHFR